MALNWRRADERRIPILRSVPDGYQIVRWPMNAGLVYEAWRLRQPDVRGSMPELLAIEREVPADDEPRRREVIDKLKQACEDDMAKRSITA